MLLYKKIPVTCNLFSSSQLPTRHPCTADPPIPRAPKNANIQGGGIGFARFHISKNNFSSEFPNHMSDQKLPKITTLKKKTPREQSLYGHTVLHLSSNFKCHRVFWNRNLVWTLLFDIWKHNSAQNHPALVLLFSEQIISLNCTGVTGKGIS